ncbi:isochorismatase family protein [Zhaonella formicivorans]|uniref:isochorismatase family protein n=1 Tax=Zhaonella formicivorans TaxID=2528593 RepID=UPI0010E673FB
MKSLVYSTTNYAYSLGYEVIVIEDCFSSNAPEIQALNIRDMANMGATIISVADYLKLLPHVHRKRTGERIRH